MIKHLAFVAALLASTTTLAGPNFLINGDFETGSLDPWFSGRSPNAGTVISPWQITSFAHSGNFAATVSGNIELRQNLNFGVNTNSITQLDLWVWDSGSCVCNAFSLFFDDGSEEQFAEFFQPQVWTHVNLLFALPANSVVTGFSIFGDDGGTTVVDDIVMDPPEDAKIFGAMLEPSTAALMLGWLALGTVLLRRRVV